MWWWVKKQLKGQVKMPITDEQFTQLQQSVTNLENENKQLKESLDKTSKSYTDLENKLVNSTSNTNPKEKDIATSVLDRWEKEKR